MHPCDTWLRQGVIFSSLLIIRDEKSATTHVDKYFSTNCTASNSSVKLNYKVLERIFSMSVFTFIWAPRFNIQVKLCNRAWISVSAIFRPYICSLYKYVVLFHLCVIADIVKFLQGDSYLLKLRFCLMQQLVSYNFFFFEISHNRNLFNGWSTMLNVRNYK